MIEVKIDLTFGLQIGNFVLLVKMRNIWYYASMEAVRSVFSWLTMKPNVTSKMPQKSNIGLAYSLKNLKKFSDP